MRLLQVHYLKLRNTTHVLSNVFIAFKGTKFYLLFAIAEAGVGPCGGP